MASQMAADIGSRVAQARNAKGLTQKQLGNLLPGTVGGDQVSKWERGEHRPYDDTLFELAKALGVQMSWLAGGNSPSLKAAVPEDEVGDSDDVLHLLQEIRTGQQHLAEQLDRLLNRRDPAEAAVAAVREYADRFTADGS